MSPEKLVVVICTGNICRSPMGAAFLARHLSSKGVSGVEVLSAGTHAMDGQGPMVEAIRAAQEHQVDVTGHRSRPLDLVLAQKADLILCATEDHRQTVLSWWPDVDPEKTRLFSDAITGEEHGDVSDPFGQDADVYVVAARVIDQAMKAWADRLLEMWGGDS